MIAKKILPLLILVLVVLFGLYLVKKRSLINTSPIMPSVTQQGSIRTTDLSLSPTILSLKKGEEKQIKVLVNSPSNQVTGIQLVLTYNPNVLTVKDISSGDFMTNPSVLLKDIDKTPGQSNFAVGTFKPKSGSGQAAIVTIVGKAPGKSTLNLDGSMVAVSNHDTDDLRKTTGTTVTVN